MMVRTSINIAASAPRIEASVHEAIGRASTTLEGTTRFAVTKIGGELTDADRFRHRADRMFTLLKGCT
jgi:flavin-binding protein dodecin